MISDWLPASDARIAAALSIALLYLTFCVWTARRHRRESTATAHDTVTAASTTLIVHASQTGFAQQLGEQTRASLHSAGADVALISVRDLHLHQLSSAQRVLFIVSTTGEGDAPDPAAGFVRTVLTQSTSLATLKYAILALGDREYDNYCAFGHRLDAWMRHQGAAPLFDVVEVDNGEEGALRHWQHQLGVIAGAPDLPDWDTPRYERWQLVQRRLLNPDSDGHACFHLTLRSSDPGITWTAGDIAEVDPRNSTWTPDSPALPHREYSIASIATDGTLELLVRQMHRPDNELGLGSGWLTQDAPVNGELALRIRPNANFHPPTTEQPLLLIGNGTGLAGLRAILQARIRAGHRRNWLLFGERNEASDYFFREEIEAWQRDGFIERLDVVFSRDQAERRYVQHRLLERSALVQQWLTTGYVYVCGSLADMAPAVDAALREIIGAPALETLLAAGRYRRDVY